MAARYTTRRLAQSEEDNGFYKMLLVFNYWASCSVGLRGVRKQIGWKTRKNCDDLPGELGYANMMAVLRKGRELRSQARDKAPSQIRNDADRIAHLQGMDEKELSALSTNELMRLGIGE